MERVSTNNEQNDVNEVIDERLPPVYRKWLSFSENWITNIVDKFR
ncbi:hypothetical protein T11_16857 [Trichinella zimbabwensis]|uniref:Uncharacterized protein n=1 Tax=Trichinella zimbabwensis TaxID=268475 RepID=A0A0V1G868_9BILA|nr:hypothetical protein T11_16857 [Trichinella zimbabwensis]